MVKGKEWRPALRVCPCFLISLGMKLISNVWNVWLCCDLMLYLHKQMTILVSTRLAVIHVE